MQIRSVFSREFPAGKNVASKQTRSSSIRFESLEDRRMMAGDVANPTIEQAIAGDSNLDGAFDSSDLVLVFTGGKFETGNPASWAEGDWNRDGVFGTTDLVLSMNGGCYGLPAPNVQQSTPVVLRPRSIFDPFFGMNASTVWVPDNWQLNGSVQFGGPPSLLLTGYVRAATPDQTMGVEGFQADANLTWTVGPLGVPPIGQFDFRGFVYAPPVDGITYFQENLFPVLRNQHPDYEVIRIDREPGLIAVQANKQAVFNQLLGAIGAQIEFDAISVQARYRVNGELIEESFVAQFSYTTSFVGQFTNTDWGLTSIERTFAPSGELFAAQPLLRTITRSATANPDWWIALNAHRNQLQGIVRNVQQDFADYIALQNEFDSQRDQLHQEFVEYLRGIDVVRNPFTGETSEIASDGHTWFSSTGEIVVNADPTFDPNLEFGGTWRKPE